MSYDELTDRELDALVAEKVMGFEWYTDGPILHIDQVDRPAKMLLPPEIKAHPLITHGRVTALHHVPWYSTNIGAAFEVVEAMRDGRGCTIDAVAIPLRGSDDEWMWGWEVKIGKGECALLSLPRAICIAALYALE